MKQIWYHFDHRITIFSFNSLKGQFQFFIYIFLWLLETTFSLSEWVSLRNKGNIKSHKSCYIRILSLWTGNKTKQRHRGIERERGWRWLHWYRFTPWDQCKTDRFHPPGSYTPVFLYIHQVLIGFLRSSETCQGSQFTKHKNLCFVSKNKQKPNCQHDFRFR